MALRLAGINVYPVKGMRGIALESALCTARGLEHDRRWMVVDAEGEFLTQRTLPRLATVWTELGGGNLTLSAPDMEAVDVPVAGSGPSARVRVWGSEVDATVVSREANRWLTEYLGFDCRLVHMPEDSYRFSNERFAGPGKLVGFADAFAYLLTTEASLDDLNARLAARHHAALPMNRFRPNLVAAGATPFAEDGWKDLRVGGAELRCVKPCGRCQVTTTDQATGEVRGPEPLATLGEFRDSKEFGVMFGVNLVTLREGTVKVGDAIEAMR
jgi:uncharacterized protein YcbX